MECCLEQGHLFLVSIKTSTVISNNNAIGQMVWIVTIPKSLLSIVEAFIVSRGHFQKQCLMPDTERSVSEEAEKQERPFITDRLSILLWTTCCFLIIKETNQVVMINSFVDSDVLQMLESSNLHILDIVEEEAVCFLHEYVFKPRLFMFKGTKDQLLRQYTTHVKITNRDPNILGCRYMIPPRVRQAKTQLTFV